MSTARNKNKTKRVVAPTQPTTAKGLAKAILQALPRGTFSTAGALAGTALAGPTGGAIGKAIGTGISAFTGYGDYVMNNIVTTEGMPKRLDPNSARTISHSEFVMDVVSQGSGFVINSVLNLNPGDEVVAPWGAPIAQRHSRYRWRKLIFEFRSTSSDYASGAALGTVILAPNYNSEAPPPATKQAMEAMTGAVSSKPSNCLLCGIECDPKDDTFRLRYCRNPQYNVPTNLTDAADLYVATSGLSAPSGTVVGELWVHYVVDLYEPAYPASVTGPVGGAAITVMTGNYIGSAPANLGASSWYTKTVLISGQQSGTNLAAGIQALPGLPSVPFILSIDTTKAGRWWFGRPGVYRLTSTVSATSAFTSQTGNPYSATFSGSLGSNVVALQGYQMGSSGMVIDYLFTIKEVCSVDWTYNSGGWGTAPNTSGGPYATFTCYS